MYFTVTYHSIFYEKNTVFYKNFSTGQKTKDVQVIPMQYPEKPLSLLSEF